MMEPNQESSYTFDPNLQKTNENPFDQGYHSEPQPIFERISSENPIYHSMNPFDVNYVQTGLDQKEVSPARESTKFSLIQNVNIYTTSRSLNEKHQEFRKNAYAPIDPDFHEKLQQELRGDKRDDKENWDQDLIDNQNSQGFEDRYQYVENEALETPQYSQSSNQYNNGNNLLHQNLEYEPGSDENLHQNEGVEDLVKNSIANFLQDPLTSSMQALQCLSVQQQKELAQTLQVIQSIQPAGNFPLGLAVPIEMEPNMNSNGSGRFTKNFYQKKNMSFNSRNKSNFHAKDMRFNQTTVNISTEKLLELIDKNQINVISLLNEAGTKIKKKVEYYMKEIPMGKVRIFECGCFLQKVKIGQKKGSSKQSAKSDAAKEGLSTILNNDKFMNERLTLASIVQRMTGRTFASNPSKSYRSNPQDFHINLLKGGDQGYSSFKNQAIFNTVNMHTKSASEISNNSNGLHENDPNMTELNNLARQLDVKPIWNIKPLMNENNEYEVQVTLQEETAKAVRESKYDAMRDAAFEILEKMKTRKESEALLQRSAEQNSIQSQSQSKNLTPIQGADKKNGKRRFFETCIEDDFFNDLQSDNQLSKDYMQKTNSEFEFYLCSNIPKQQPNAIVIQSFYEIFNKLKDYTHTAIVKGEKPELAKGEKHITEYINQCHLIPTGSGALECMRNNKLVFDVLFIFAEAKEVSELEFLEMYQNALERAQSVKQEDEEEGECSTDAKFTFAVKSESLGNFLEIEDTRKINKPLKIRIFLSRLGKKEEETMDELFLDKYDYSILHIKRIFNCFEDMENQLKDFKRLLLVLRAWRDTNKLGFLRPEILDIILLREFFNYKFMGFANPIINCLMVLGSEETITNFLSQYDSIYNNYYQKISEDSKSELFSACNKTLSQIFRRDFREISIFTDSN